MAGHGKPGKFSLSNFSLSEDMSTCANFCPADRLFYVTGRQSLALHEFAVS